MIISKLKKYIFLCSFIHVVFMLPACSSSPEPSNWQENITYSHSRPLFIQNYIDAMTDSLIVSDENHRIKRGRIAVGSIGMIKTLMLSEDAHHPLNMLGLKLQDGLMSSLLNRGYKVIEYHRTKNIIIRDDQDQMLSRTIDDLKGNQELNYFLTGTIAYQEGGASISLRIIDLNDDQVSAATTKFIPIDVFWGQRQVTGYNGMIYRNSQVEVNK
jgi:hypothetical protein